MSNRNEHLITQARIQDALLTRRAEQSLRAFVEQAWRLLEHETLFVPNWHIDLLCEALEDVTAGVTPRLLVTVPPRSMKSLLVSIFWPIWEWTQRPSGRWIFASYAETLAVKHSVDRRSLVQSPWYQERWGDRVRLAADQNVKGEFQNTQRGVMVATSVSGSITGKGGDRIVVDDLLNPQQSDSDAQRETSQRYFRETLATRLDNKKTGAVVVVMQRLHQRDLAAFCQDLGYTEVCLPAEAETRTEIVYPRSGRIRVREAGDLLWPAREGRAELDMQKRLLGSSAYAAQYQQRPTPPGGTIFQRDWLKYYDEPPQFEEILQSWDMAFKDQPDNDYVVGLVLGRCGANFYIIDRVKGQWSFSESCRQVERLAQKHREAWTILIEDAANGPAIIDALKHRLSGLVAVSPEGGKIARARAVQPLVEAGNVFLPNPRPHGVLMSERTWVEDFVYQLTAFPNGAHDDDVDAFSQALVRLQKPRYTSATW